MSRVEPKDRSAARQTQSSRRQPADRTPSKAEGDERTTDEALRNQERARK
jgi:hypothetical protein